MEWLTDAQRLVVAVWAALTVLVVWYGLATTFLSSFRSRRERIVELKRQLAELTDDSLEYVPPPS